METRKITIANTRNQKKSVVMTAATTLGELKRDLDAAGIDYYEMDFIEALTKTQLRGDDSVLPHNVPYNHTITNELVFLLTAPNRKIKSGIDREDVYERINNHVDAFDLKEAIKDRFGGNYTMVRTSDLIEFVNEWDGAEVEQNDSVEECVCLDCRVEALEQKVDNMYEALMETIDILDIDYDTESVYHALTKGMKKKDSTVYSAGMSSDDIDELIASVD